jgi:hypothetical protein
MVRRASPTRVYREFRNMVKPKFKDVVKVR